LAEEGPLNSTVIACWFVADAENERTAFPQVGGASHTPEFQSVYWRCALGFYSASVKVNPDRRHMFFTNCPLPRVGGIALQQHFLRLNVEVVHLPITYRLPAGFVSSWGNQFYIFDIIKYTARTLTNERIIVLDSDCLFVKPVDEMESAIDTHGALTYTLYLSDSPDHIVNGLSRRDLATVAKNVFGLDTGFVHYAGGEIFASTAAECRAIQPLIDRLWEYTVANNNRLFPHEEAQALSIIYQMRGYADSSANPYIKRIWTLLRKSTASRSDSSLTVWHLPAEKKSGFRSLFRDCINPDSDFSRARHQNDLRAYYGRVMGVPRRGPFKFSRDLSAKVREQMWPSWRQ
jgi:hypothetical protein